MDGVLLVGLIGSIVFGYTTQSWWVGLGIAAYVIMLVGFGVKGLGDVFHNRSTIR